MKVRSWELLNLQHKGLLRTCVESQKEEEEELDKKKKQYFAGEPPWSQVEGNF